MADFRAAQDRGAAYADRRPHQTQRGKGLFERLFVEELDPAERRFGPLLGCVGGSLTVLLGALRSIAGSMADSAKKTSYEDAVLTILAREFSSTNIKETEAKIKRKLRAKNIGKYDQRRVDRLRCLKDTLETEISKGETSRYYSNSAGEFANMQDFDTQRMTEDLAAGFPEVPKQSIHEFVDYFVYLHYLR